MDGRRRSSRLRERASQPEQATRIEVAETQIGSSDVNVLPQPQPQQQQTGADTTTPPPDSPHQTPSIALPNSAIPLFDFHLNLGPNPGLDRPGLSAYKEPVFVPACYEDLRSSLRFWFPDAKPPPPAESAIKAWEDRQKKENAIPESSVDTQEEPSVTTASPLKRKRKPKSVADPEQARDEFKLELEIVPMSRKLRELGILEAGFSTTHVYCFAVHALAPLEVAERLEAEQHRLQRLLEKRKRKLGPKRKSPSPTEKDKVTDETKATSVELGSDYESEGHSIDLDEDDKRQVEPTYEPYGASLDSSGSLELASAEEARILQANDRLLLGFILRGSIKDRKHPLFHLDTNLVHKGWVSMCGEATLYAPFFPPDEVIVGPESRHAFGRCLYDPQSDRALDPVTKHHFWREDPRRYTPAPWLLGSIYVEVALQPDALRYGLEDTVDGFIAEFADLKGAGSLMLAHRMRNFLPHVVDHPDGFLEIDDREKLFWDNDADTYYRLPPKQDRLTNLPRISPSLRSSSKTSPNSTSKVKSRNKTKFISRVDQIMAPSRASSSKEVMEDLPIWNEPESSQSDDDERHLPLDNNIASLLEMCRPQPDGPVFFPPSEVILTPLLKYQARCLAWMMKREQVLDQESNLLHPNWIPLRSKDASSIIEIRRRLYRDTKLAQQFFGSALPPKRQKKEKHSSKGKSKATEMNLVKMEEDDDDLLDLPEPFFDPVPFAFYLDQTSGTPSLRRFTCRTSEPGGALCEAMGLGKTLECLALVASHPRPDTADLLDHDRSRSAKMISSMGADELRPFVSKATLIVCPAALIEQWADEVKKHFRSRRASARDSNYSGQGNEATEVAQPGVIRFTGASLDWSEGDSREDVRKWAHDHLVEPDIVLATYEELATQLAHSERARRWGREVRSPLLEVLFWRIMLDEAQIVAASSSKATSMIHELWRTNCWMVTGTPVTRGIKDLQGIFSFLDHDPFASTYMFRQVLQLPFTDGEVEGIRRMRSILPRYVWRHTKVHVKDEIALPPSCTEWLELDLPEIERIFYERELKHHRDVQGERAGKGIKTAGNLDFLVSLRQLLSHPQVAEQLGYGSRNKRLTFAELFDTLCQRTETELESLRREVVNVTLQLAWGHQFYNEEQNKKKWTGGRKVWNKQQRTDAVKRALLICEKAIRNVKQTKEQDSTEPDPVQGENNAEDGKNSLQPLSEGSAVVNKGKAGSVGKEASANHPASHMDWQEAYYWLKTLSVEGSQRDDSKKPRVKEPEGRWDPERPTKVFFEKTFKKATDRGVDLTDPRFHLVVQDAGSEDMTEEERLSFFNDPQAQGSSASTDPPDGDQNRLVPDGPSAGSAAGKGKNRDQGGGGFEPVLTKSRLRGNASQRQEKRVWFYKPKEKLASTLVRLNMIVAAQEAKEHEVNFLHKRREEELGHGSDDAAPGASGVDQDDSKANEQQGAASECAVCLEPILVPGVLPCYHSFCFECISTLIKNGAGRGQCPACRSYFRVEQVTEIVQPVRREKSRSGNAGDEGQDTDEAIRGDWGGKISGLITDLRKRLRQDPSQKAVIFSHWKRMLSFIKGALLQNGIGTVAFDGGPQAQAFALNSIRDDDHTKVILVPFRASEGAAGLTLTCCNLAYMMEPALDGALEAQAAGRINRIGQTRATTVIRVKMKDTIEDAVVQIAERKASAGLAKVAGAGGGDEGDALSSQRTESIRSSLGSSVGAAKGKTEASHNLTMEDVAQILGFDIEEQKRVFAERMRQRELARAAERQMMAQLRWFFEVYTDSDDELWY